MVKLFLFLEPSTTIISKNKIKIKDCSIKIISAMENKKASNFLNNNPTKFSEIYLNHYYSESFSAAHYLASFKKRF